MIGSEKVKGLPLRLGMDTVENENRYFSRKTFYDLFHKYLIDMQGENGFL